MSSLLLQPPGQLMKNPGRRGPKYRLIYLIMNILSSFFKLIIEFPWFWAPFSCRQCVALWKKTLSNLGNISFHCNAMVVFRRRPGQAQLRDEIARALTSHTDTFSLVGKYAGSCYRPDSSVGRALVFRSDGSDGSGFEPHDGRSVFAFFFCVCHCSVKGCKHPCCYKNWNDIIWTVMYKFIIMMFAIVPQVKLNES